MLRLGTHQHQHQHQSSSLNGCHKSALQRVCDAVSQWYTQTASAKALRIGASYLLNLSNSQSKPLRLAVINTSWGSEMGVVINARIIPVTIIPFDEIICLPHICTISATHPPAHKAVAEMFELAPHDVFTL